MHRTTAELTGRARGGQPFSLFRSAADGAFLGMLAGIVYGLIVACWVSVTLSSSPAVHIDLSAFLSVAVIAGFVAAPIGVVLGAVLGLFVGLAAVRGVRRLAWPSAFITATCGAAIVGLAALGEGGITAALLMWTGGPLFVGPVAAWILGHRVAIHLG